MNKKRKAIWDKSNGYCWYCGCKLGDKWHEDHFEPIVRNMEYRDGTIKPKKGCGFPERDNEQNKVPSCPSCNIMKSSVPLESFRNQISGFINSLNRDSTQYKFAKRYGLVQETNIEIKFWFEKEGL